jgi:hypothetical protein
MPSARSPPNEKPWCSGHHEPMPAVNRSKAALGAFYAEAFGWTINPLPDTDYALVETGGGLPGGIGSMGAEAPRVTIYVETDDLDAALAKVEAAGGKVVVPVTEIPDMVTFAHVADPAGTIVGLVKEREA